MAREKGTFCCHSIHFHLKTSHKTENVVQTHCKTSLWTQQQEKKFFHQYFLMHFTEKKEWKLPQQRILLRRMRKKI